VTFSLAVQYASRSKTLPERAQVRRWALAAHTLAQESLKLNSLDSEVTIRYVDEEEGRELNKSFRGKDYATNVLTFVDDSQAPAKSIGSHRHSSFVIRPAAKRLVADIAICAPVVSREANAQKKSVRDHHAHMVVHGVLHAMGFDHEKDDDAQTMEAIEIQVLRRFRINNPYEIAS
jgi:probable rRNA maturation factor